MIENLTGREVITYVGTADVRNRWVLRLAETSTGRYTVTLVGGRRLKNVREASLRREWKAWQPEVAAMLARREAVAGVSR